VANTNPVLANAEYTTDIIHNTAALDMKRNLQFPGVTSSNILCSTAFKNSTSDCESLLDMMRDKMDIDLSDEDDDFDNLSEIVDDEDKNMIFAFMRLRPRTTKFLSENLEADEEDPTGFPLDIFEAPARFEVEYEDCAEGAQNRSQCCGGDPDEFKDIGLDSTMSFSMKDDINSIRNISRRRGHRTMSQSGENNLFSSGNKKSQYQTAISQYNFNDLDGDQEEEDQDFKFKDIEMLMLAEKGDKLKINKQMSQRVSFAVSDSKHHNINFESRKHSH